MDLNQYLPALVPALLALIVFGAAGLIALSWTQSPELRLWIRRALFVLVLVCIGGPLLLWLTNRLTGASAHHGIDRSLQQQQQDELRKRVNNGGH